MAKKRKTFLTLIIIIVVIVTAAYFFYTDGAQGSESDYQFAEVSRGNIESTISASGTLSPVTEVEVGTQVSGKIDKLYVDFNDNVKAGQLLAVLDTIPLKAAVVEAQANVEKIKAQLEQAQFDFDTRSKMIKQNKDLVAESEFISYSVALKTQKANLKSAEAALSRADRNLNYAMIRSPINGIVIERSVEEGQTVAASLSSPVLFKIAKDMETMEILVDVDESDIGQIKDGQQVRFQVATYADVDFEGTVRQIRLQPQVVSNVVTYTVVVNAHNKDNLLLPGMTATVDFIIDKKENVLLVPNKALRYQPDQVTMQAYFDKMRSEREARNGSDSTAGQPGSSFAGRPGGMPNGAGHQRPKDRGMLWYLDENGKLAMEPVRTGMTDGTNTEITRSRNLTEGMQIISGVASTEKTENTNENRRPFGPRF